MDRGSFGGERSAEDRRRVRAAVRLAAAVVATLAALALVVLWIEAEKEVRILCGTFDPGEPVEGVHRTLDTGNLLRRSVRDDGTIDVWSPWTLGTSRCEVRTAGGVVRSATYR